MAQIDRLIASLGDVAGATILLSPEQPAELFGKGQMRPLTKHPLSTRQILALVREVAPPSALTDLDLGGRATFTYPSPEGPVRIAVERGAAGVRVRIGDGSIEGTDDAPLLTPIGTPNWPMVAITDSALRVVGLEDSPRGRLEALLQAMLDRGASDLHLRAGEPPVLRMNGELLRLEGARC